MPLGIRKEVSHVTPSSRRSCSNTVRWTGSVFRDPPHARPVVEFVCNDPATRARPTATHRLPWGGLDRRSNLRGAQGSIPTVLLGHIQVDGSCNGQEDLSRLLHLRHACPVG